MQRRTFVSNLMYVGSVLTVRVGEFTRASYAAAAVRQKAFASLAIGAIYPARHSVFGATLGVEEAQHASRMFDSDVTFITEELSTENDSAKRAATRLLARARVSAIIGGGSDEECIALDQFCNDQGLLYFNTVNQSDALRDRRCGSRTFHVQPSARMKTDALAIANVLTPRMQAVADSGVIPVEVKGVAHSGGANATSERKAVAWHSGLNKYGADTLNTRFRARFGISMDENSWADWFAVKAIWETFLRARPANADSLADALVQPAARFDGHKGRQLSFRTWDHQLRQPLYVIAPSTEETPAIIEVPAGGTDEPAQQALDVLGTSELLSRCKFGAQP